MGSGHWDAGVAFSSSGDFAYVRDGRDDPRWQIIKNDIESTSKSYRYMQHYLALDGAFYTTYISGANSLQLKLTKPEPTEKDGALEHVILRNQVHFSSSYAYTCQVFLLLGATDEDDMHALLIPNNDDAAEIQRIPLTWAKARAILDQKWETACRRTLQVPYENSQDEHAGQGKSGQSNNV